MNEKKQCFSNSCLPIENVNPVSAARSAPTVETTVWMNGTLNEVENFAVSDLYRQLPVGQHSTRGMN